MSETNALLMTHEVAAKLGISLRTVHRWVSVGKLTPCRINGNRPYYAAEDVNALAAERRRVLLAKAALLSEAVK